MGRGQKAAHEMHRGTSLPPKLTSSLPGPNQFQRVWLGFAEPPAFISAIESQKRASSSSPPSFGALGFQAMVLALSTLSLDWKPEFVGNCCTGSHMSVGGLFAWTCSNQNNGSVGELQCGIHELSY
jgi:hypothetical protein